MPTPTSNVLYQFQCQKDGTIFYYQTGCKPFLVRVCPVCGSQRVKATGRVYAPVDERMDDQTVLAGRMSGRAPGGGI